MLPDTNRVSIIMALIYKHNQIVKFPSTESCNVEYDALHNEYKGKGEKAYAMMRKPLKEILSPMNNHQGNMFSIGANARLV